jgi:hypothetical protein
MVSRIELFKRENVTLRLSKHGKYSLTISEDEGDGCFSLQNSLENEPLMLLRALLRAVADDDFNGRRISDSTFGEAVNAVFEVEQSSRIRGEAFSRREAYSAKMRSARSQALAGNVDRAESILAELKVLSEEVK